MATAARSDLTRFAWLSIAAAVATIALKMGAYLITDSVGLLSDALESIVNLVAAIVALIALTVAARPADAGHHFGHTKAEYLSAVVEGAMIFVAALSIIYTAVRRLIHPVELANVGIGLSISVVAALLNGAVALVLIRAGRTHRSMTLKADGKHLMTDVWTSAGVVVGVLLVVVTGILRLDPIVALLVGLNIVRTGVHLLRDSVGGLLDRAMDADTQALVDGALEEFASDEVTFHAVRSREAGHRWFVSLHVLVPGDWSVRRGHDLADAVERRLGEVLEHVEVETHLEPREDPRSYEAYLGVPTPDELTGTDAAGRPDLA
ncbi:MAG: cation diffusion facilitator family transporter [Nocardioides sp.]